MRCNFSPHIAQATGATRKALRRGCFCRAGQALVELAVFGSLLLLLMGAILSYGLSYDLQQQADQQAFRTALFYQGSDPSNPYTASSISYQITKMRHIPDPADAYGFGSTAHATGSASVTWDFGMDLTPMTEDSLPVSVMDIQTGLTDGRATWEHGAYHLAGFRDISNVPAGSIDRYEEIYGFVSYRQSSGGWGSEGGAVMAGSNYAAIRVIDRCVSNILDHDSCYVQARMIVDSSFCTYQCNENKATGSTINCSSVCSAAIEVPWYAQGYSSTGTDPNGYTLYSFPVLNQIFQVYENMGFQTNPTINSVRNSTFNIAETPANIRTNESASWTETTDIPFVYNNNLPPPGSGTNAGVDRERVDVAAWDEVSEQVVRETHNQRWTTTK